MQGALAALATARRPPPSKAAVERALRCFDLDRAGVLSTQQLLDILIDPRGAAPLSREEADTILASLGCAEATTIGCDTIAQRLANVQSAFVALR